MTKNVNDNRKLITISFYIFLILSILGFFDFLTSEAGSKAMSDFYGVEVERWGYITVFLFEMGRASGSVAILKTSMFLGGAMNQAWAFFSFIAIVLKFKYLRKQKDVSETA